jgi:hypothetical protein
MEQQIFSDINRLKSEILYVFENDVLPNWGSEKLHGFPDTLYGFVMRTLSFIDLLSQLWDLAPEHIKKSKGHQTARMIDFMDIYFDSDREKNTVLVFMWRHTLIHTTAPRIITDCKTGIKYNWLLHWGAPHLPLEQHYEFNTNTPNQKILCIGLTYLINQLITAITDYTKDLKSNPDLRANLVKVEHKLNNVIKRIN